MQEISSDWIHSTNFPIPFVKAHGTNQDIKKVILHYNAMPLSYTAKCLQMEEVPSICGLLANSHLCFCEQNCKMRLSVNIPRTTVEYWKQKRSAKQRNKHCKVQTVFGKSTTRNVKVNFKFSSYENIVDSIVFH